MGAKRAKRLAFQKLKEINLERLVSGVQCFQEFIFDDLEKKFKTGHRKSSFFYSFLIL